MLFEERAEKILTAVDKKGSASVTELAIEIGTSESTIRRDIAALDKQGKLKKVYGGAARTSNPVFTDEYDVKTKSAMNIEQKQKIAEYAAKTINDDDFVFIDAGTTTLMMIPFIKASGAVFVTNGIAHAKALIQAGFKTYITGGQLKFTTEAIIGHDAAAYIEKYNFTKAFMGTNGIDIDRGFTTPDIDEALIKEAAINHSYISYILADSSKFKQISSVTFAKIEKACIITDKPSDEKFKKYTVIKVVM